jgi:hypothetical protein
MKKLNLVRYILFLPFAVVLFIPSAIIGFFCTDWESENDRRFFKETTIGMFKLKK